MSLFTPTIAKFSTGASAFAAAGCLVIAIMSGHGGTADSQQKWQEASRNSVSLGGSRQIAEIDANQMPDLGIDRTVTGSIRNIADGQDEVAVKPQPNAEQQLSVLELIRKNSDVAPGVSSGTGRVSVTIKKGDTLYGISKRHGISISALARLNGLEEPFTIKIGQTLYVAR